MKNKEFNIKVIRKTSSQQSVPPRDSLGEDAVQVKFPPYSSNKKEMKMS